MYKCLELNLLQIIGYLVLKFKRVEQKRSKFERKFKDKSITLPHYIVRLNFKLINDFTDINTPTFLEKNFIFKFINK